MKTSYLSWAFCTTLLSVGSSAIASKMNSAAQSPGAPVAAVAADRVKRYEAAPSTPSAPNSGVIVSVDAARQDIVISAKHYVIGSPLLALLDKRRDATGLLMVATLQPGMQVRYREVQEGGNSRIVELWVLRDAASRAGGGK